MKDPVEDIYTAGLIDGEGTITLTRLHRNTWRAPVVSFSSSSRELIDFFRAAYGGSVVAKKTYAHHHMASWECRLTHNAALALLARMYPYLKHEEKRYRARLLLTRYKEVTPRNGRYTPATQRKKREFEQRFFHPSTP